MTHFERIAVKLSMVLALTLGVTQAVPAMHIMEGFLPAGHCVVWGAICIPFLLIGFMKIKKTVSEHRKTLLLFAMVGAYAFVLSALKIPSVTGSSSHPTGTGLGAVLFGPAPMAILGIIVLLFQAILLAHGGLTTLGANTFSMAVAGPFMTYGLYVLLKKLKLNRLMCVFFAAAIGNLFTYVVTSFQLAFAHPSAVGGMLASLVEFLTVFAITQIPLAIIEGFLTVAVILALESYARPELDELGYVGGAAV